MEHILSMIGLAKKAGRVEIGEEPVGSAARSKHARVILVASDAAASSVRRAYAFAQTGACLCLTIPADKDALGRALGRSSCAMAAITDVGFADAIVKKLAVMDPEHYEQASQRLQIKARRAMERREEQARHEKNLRRGKKRTAPPEPPQPVQEPPREAAKEKPRRPAPPGPPPPPFLRFETGRYQSGTFAFFSQSWNSSRVMTSRSHFFFISLACSLQA